MSDQRIRLWSLTKKHTDVLQARLEEVAKVQERPPEGDNEDIEENTGIEFPGDSLEPLMGQAVKMEDDILLHKVLFVEYLEKEGDRFLFKFNRKEQMIIGQCEHCYNKRTLKAVCACKKVRYCNDHCLEKDRRWHLPHCSSYQTKDLEITTFQRKPNACMGVVGLANLGNTCYMNSSLQCLSNCWELSNYFLSELYSKDLNTDNPIGNEGKVAMAYAKLMNEMWFENQQVVVPRTFKKTLGMFKEDFRGYDQHDSQECINTVLDFLSEDLYRKSKKPMVPNLDFDEKSDTHESANKAWNYFLQRNDSVIVDLFYGQYKSTLVCSLCNKVSITYDPYLTVALPIPGKPAKRVLFFIPYNISSDNYACKKGVVVLRETDSMLDLRHQVMQKYGRHIDGKGSFLITTVQDQELKKMYGINDKVGDLTAGTLLLYEINPDLHPTLPSSEVATKSDSNHNLGKEWVKVVLLMKQSERGQYSRYTMTRNKNIPRIMWVNRNWTLQELHFQIFVFFRGFFEKWI